MEKRLRGNRSRCFDLMMKRIAQLLELFTKKERYQLLALSIMMLFGSALEVASISLILPFVQILENPVLAFSQSRLNFLSPLVPRNEPLAITLVVGLFLAAFYFLKSVYGLGQWFLFYRFIYRISAFVSRELFSVYLRQPYAFHLNRHSSELIRNTTTQVAIVCMSVVFPLMSMITEFAVLLGLVILLLKTALLPAAGTVALVGFVGWVMTRLLRPRIQRIAHTSIKNEALMIRWVSQGLEGIREIKLLGKEDFVAGKFGHSVENYSYSQMQNSLFSRIPRMVAEPTVILTVILFIALLMMTRRPDSSLLPTIAVFGAAALRLSPSFTTFTMMLNKLRFSLPSIDIVCGDFALARARAEAERLTTGQAIQFQREIKFEDISHKYPNRTEPALQGISLTITRGDYVAFVGPSGSGKSTLVSLLLGLLKPTAGRITVDGVDVQDDLKGWQSQIGYIPQEIFLIDDTIRNNIAFGIAERDISDARLTAVLEQVQLAAFIREQPLGLNTVVGERGLCLSGGQRQRIGIARALYRDPKVLILDEATSALDHGTEKEVSEAINKVAGEKTVIVITHRLASIEKCKNKYSLNTGRIEGLAPDRFIQPESYESADVR